MKGISKSLLLKCTRLNITFVLEPFQELFTPAIRGNNDWLIPKVRTVNKGVETIRYRGPKTRKLVPIEIKISKSLSSFKEKNQKVETCGLHM